MDLHRSMIINELNIFTATWLCLALKCFISRRRLLVALTKSTKPLVRSKHEPGILTTAISSPVVKLPSNLSLVK